MWEEGRECGELSFLCSHFPLCLRTLTDLGARSLSWCASLGQHSLAQNTELGKRLTPTRGLTAISLLLPYPSQLMIALDY